MFFEKFNQNSRDLIKFYNVIKNSDTFRQAEKKMGYIKLKEVEKPLQSKKKSSYTNPFTT